VGEFARRRLGDEIARRIVGPFVTGIYAADADEISLRAAFPALADLDARGGLVRGMLARRRDGGPRKPRRKARLCAPVNGAEALARALADAISDRLQVNQAVQSVRFEDGAVSVVVDGAARAFDAAVLATPAHITGSLVAGAAPELGAALGELTYAPVVVVHLGFDRADIPHPLDGFGFLVAKGERLRLLGCVFESVLYPNRAPEGKVLLRCIFGGTRDPEATALSDQDLVSAARRDLKRVLGIEHKPGHVNIARWPRAIALYTPGHLDRVARAEALAEPRGLVLAGSAYHGVAVNSCIADARRVVRKVRASLGLALLACLMVACGGGKRSERTQGQHDGGDGGAAIAEPAAPTTPEGAAPPYLLAPLDAEGAVIGAGSLDVFVSWSDPPAELLRSPGFDPCGRRRSPPVSVHTLHGLRDAVVTIEGIARGRAPGPARPTELVVDGCALAPRVQVASRLGAPLAVSSASERRAEISLDRVEGGDPVAHFAMPLIGQRYELPLADGGLYRATLAGTDAAYVYAPPHPYVAITDEAGHARFSDVPPGSYEIVAWHPPIAAGAAPLVARGQVTVEAGGAAELTIEPRPPT
jgi:oxygen-dependent protoporphyrinogen oxidase